MKEDFDYVRVKVKCMSCRLHFVICTWHPEKHSPLSLYCPECGQHEGAFLVWHELASGAICAEVPGTASFVTGGG